MLQGIYRRADANWGLGRMKKALTDYKRAAQVNARDPDLRKKLTQCEKEVKRIRFEEAVATPVSSPSFQKDPADRRAILLQSSKTFTELLCIEYMLREAKTLERKAMTPETRWLCCFCA